MDSQAEAGTPRTISQALSTTFKLIWQESDGFTRRQLALSFALLLTGSVLSALYPVIYKLTVDAFSGQASPESLIAPGLLIAGLVLCNYAVTVSFGLREFVHGLGVQRLNRRISNRLFGHIVRLPLHFHLERKTGAIGETISQSLNGCRILLQHAVFTFLPVAIEFIAITLVLVHFQHSAYLAILGLAGAAYGYTFWRAAEEIAEPSRNASTAHVEAQATLTCRPWESQPGMSRKVLRSSRRCSTCSVVPEVGNPGLRESIAFGHVTFSFRADRATLKDVSFRLPAGHTLGIVGSSGSGKTSVIRLLFRLYEPQEGRILLDDIPITTLSLLDLRSAIAVVPQDTVPFNDTIANNIAFGKLGATRAEIEEAAKLAHLDQFIARLPDGYETRVGERGLKLSGGEKQRVVIARAALMRPLIYVFDEATSSLDSRTEREILENPIDVAKSSTTIVVAHRLSTVAHADKIVVLDNGSMVEGGPQQELIEHGCVYRMLWKAQNPAKTLAVAG